MDMFRGPRRFCPPKPTRTTKPPAKKEVFEGTSHATDAVRGDLSGTGEENESALVAKNSEERFPVASIHKNKGAPLKPTAISEAPAMNDKLKPTPDDSGSDSSDSDRDSGSDSLGSDSDDDSSYSSEDNGFDSSEDNDPVAVVISKMQSTLAEQLQHSATCPNITLQQVGDRSQEVTPGQSTMDTIQKTGHTKNSNAPGVKNIQKNDPVGDSITKKGGSHGSNQPLMSSTVRTMEVDRGTPDDNLWEGELPLGWMTTIENGQGTSKEERYWYSPSGQKYHSLGQVREALSAFEDRKSALEEMNCKEIRHVPSKPTTVGEQPAKNEPVKVKSKSPTTDKSRGHSKATQIKPRSCSAWQKINKLLTDCCCATCFEPFSSRLDSSNCPMVGSCGHSMCRGCLDRYDMALNREINQCNATTSQENECQKPKARRINVPCWNNCIRPGDRKKQKNKQVKLVAFKLNQLVPNHSLCYALTALQKDGASARTEGVASNGDMNLTFNQCPLCKEDFSAETRSSKNPDEIHPRAAMVGTCGHSFCATCLYEKHSLRVMERDSPTLKKFPCPQCKKNAAFQSNMLFHNHAFKSLLVTWNASSWKRKKNMPDLPDVSEQCRVNKVTREMPVNKQATNVKAVQQVAINKLRAAVEAIAPPNADGPKFLGKKVMLDLPDASMQCPINRVAERATNKQAATNIKTGRQLPLGQSQMLLQKTSRTTATNIETGGRPFISQLQTSQQNKSWMTLEEELECITAAVVSRLKKRRAGEWDASDNGDDEKCPHVPSKRRRTSKPGLNGNGPIENEIDMLETIPIGCRVEVFWPDDNQYYPGTITKKREKATRSNKAFYLEYDDGDSEWLNLGEHVHRIIDTDDEDVAAPNSSGEQKPGAAAQSLSANYLSAQSKLQNGTSLEPGHLQVTLQTDPNANSKHLKCRIARVSGIQITPKGGNGEKASAKPKTSTPREVARLTLEENMDEKKVTKTSRSEDKMRQREVAKGMLRRYRRITKSSATRSPIFSAPKGARRCEKDEVLMEDNEEVSKPATEEASKPNAKGQEKTKEVVWEDPDPKDMQDESSIKRRGGKQIQHRNSSCCKRSRLG